MLAMKIKATTKFKSYGKCDLLRIRLCDEISCSSKHKTNFKDYIDEIFAGLIWLG